MSLIVYIIIGILIILLLLLMKIFFIGGKNCRFNTDLTGKIAIVTGANSGIGKYTAFKLAD